ncbi:GtrA family protein [Rhizobium sp.]
MKRFGWFLVAGSIGFLADAGMLALLLNLTPLGPFTARIIAILFALSVTWGFNRAVTFGKSRFPLLLEGARYGSVGLLSATLNYAVYAGLLLALPFLHPLLALAVASLIAMAFSWAGYSRFVFQK